MLSFDDSETKHLAIAEDFEKIVFKTPSSVNNSNDKNASIKVIRSGNRNLLNAIAGNIIALDNPTENLDRDIFESGPINSNVGEELVEFLKNPSTRHLTLPADINFASSSGKASNLKMGMYADLSSYPALQEKFSKIELSLSDKDFEPHPDYFYFSEFRAIKMKLYHKLYNDNGIVYEFSNFLPNVAMEQEQIWYTNNMLVLKGIDKGYLTEEGWDNDGGESDRVVTDISLFNKKVHIYNSKNVLQASAVEFSNTWDYGMDLGLGSEYFTGEKGIWRVSKNHYYKDERISSNSKEQYAQDEHNLSHDGVFQGGYDETTDEFSKDYFHFSWIAPDVNHENWVANEQITKYNRDGFAVESKDILGNYSFAKYGYGGNLVTTVGANAQENEVFFEDFENINSSNPNYPNFSISEIGHTGKKAGSLGNPGGEMNLNNFTPNPGERFILSAWVAEFKPAPKAPLTNHSANYSFDGIKIKSNNTNWQENNADIEAKVVGGKIEGWQKVEVAFHVPSNYNGKDLITLSFPSGFYYYDDIKICPFDAATKSYVYNPQNFRLVAELDNNNYATYYYYDSQGSLHLTKVETSEGIMTVSESRGHVKEGSN